MRTLVIITSYNRNDSLNRLLSDLLKYDVDIVVFDDKTPNLIRQDNERISYIINQEHRGKEGFWKTYQDIFDYCKGHNHDYYIFLQDDITICDNFIDKLVEQFSVMSNHSCISLCPMLTQNVLRNKRSRWGNKDIVVYDTYADTHYFDCCGIVDNRFFQALNWEMYAISKSRFENNPYISSGVGEQITTRLQYGGFKMCHCVPSMIATGSEVSVMNKEERERNPLNAVIPQYKDSVDVYIASLWRDGYIIETLKSILLQEEVHSVNVSLNNYTNEQAKKVMSAVKDKRITWHRTDNEKCSNEKLRFVREGNAKYVAFADDDLIYSPIHFKRLISKCEAYNGGVSMHGGIMKHLPIESYYSGRNVYKCLDNLLQDVQVDIIGNGVALYKREWLNSNEWKELYDNATNVSMDDIIVSCAMNKKNIPVYVVAHLSMQHKERKQSDNYVADRYYNDDSIQCEYINNNYTRLFTLGNIVNPRYANMVKRYQRRYPNCDVWIEGKFLCLRRKGRSGEPTRYAL